MWYVMQASAGGGGSDFEIEGELEFKRNGAGVCYVPADYCVTSLGLSPSKNRLEFSGQSNDYTGEDLFVWFATAIGNQNAWIRPMKAVVEADEVWANIKYSTLTTGHFTSFRWFLAVRSTRYPI